MKPHTLRKGITLVPLARPRVFETDALNDGIRKAGVFLFRGLPLASLLLLAACSGQQPRTLGSLKYEAPRAAAPEQLAEASHEDVRAQYQQLLEMINDQEIKEQIERRIADVYMLEGEQTVVEPEAGKSYYLEAIKSYRDILEKYPNSPDNADVLYQLAKAYDMEGNQSEALVMLQELTRRHPDYPHIAEASFRKADILFNLGDYAGAEAAYAVVTEHQGSSFYLNAHYMLGWSRYKQLQFRPAMDNFVHVLNDLLSGGAELEDLAKPQQSLVDDTLHAVSLSLDKLAGAATIQEIPELKSQHYVWRLYDELGRYYLDKELYEASAESYRQFVANYPDNDRAPIMHRKVIDTYMEGSFPGQAFAEKEIFVDAYGIYSDYARSRGGIVADIEDSIREYLDELARNYHARGQNLQKEIAKLEDAESEGQRAAPEKVAELDGQAIESLNKAAHFYLQYLETFPDYEKRDELVFFRAEALFAARRYAESIDAYEAVAYRPETESAEAYGANAGYAAIVAFENHLAGLKDESRAGNQWRAKAVESMLRFAERYHQDERSPAVLTNAAEYMFSLEQYQRALDISQQLVQNNPDLDSAVKKTAYGISAHSLFKLERFDEAASDYALQRELTAPDSEEYREITERLASAVYKHAESLIAAGDKNNAADVLLSLKELAPDSPVRITGQYDAASLLLELEQWPKAISELLEVAELYPEHELTAEIPRKLAFAYENNEDWALAADAYRELAENDPNPDLRRESLYLSANMYEKDGNYLAAIEQYRSYAHGYPEPFGTNMEARYKLTEHYKRMGDLEKRRFWLDKLVEGHRDAGDQQNERSRWLAAWANMEYGDYYAEEFRRYNLYPPLNKSLPPKNRQLERATERYQQAADSELFEFVTMSAYKIGALYQGLAKELRESPRPAGLSAEEKVLYAEILAEQSLPFDEIAMELYQSNLDRMWQGEYNSWIEQSFAMMRELHPARFGKSELIVSYGDEIR